jgi:hypothetical protein
MFKFLNLEIKVNWDILTPCILSMSSKVKKVKCNQNIFIIHALQHKNYWFHYFLSPDYWSQFQGSNTGSIPISIDVKLDWF